MKTKLVLAVTTIALAMTVLIYVYYLHSSGQIAYTFNEDSRLSRQNMRTAEIILSELDAISADQGRYPQHLADLVPKYLPAIPPSVYGDQTWMYSVFDDGKAYQLSYSAPGGYPSCYFQSQDGGWKVDR